MENKELEKRIEKIESFIKDIPHMLSHLAKRITFLEEEIEAKFEEEEDGK